jgi:predicted ATPase/DNA-binding winged helix-turn-helix (wHTH) protein
MAMAGGDTPVFRFGATAFVPARRELHHDGERVPVGDRALDLLFLLIDARGSIVSKDRMMERVWSGRIVGENALESQMSTLRRALGRDRNVIKTITGRGYQFVGELHVVEPIVQPIEAHAEASGTDLPASVSPLIGRERELDEIARMLDAHRLVTLVGPGGVGKTRLAIEAARMASDRFSERAVFVGLAATSDAKDVPAAMATAFIFAPGDGTMGLDKLASRLRDEERFVLVDNCEHVVDSAARVIEALLHIAPRVTVLATSREPLRVTGEHIVRVPSLDVPATDECAEDREYGSILLLRERMRDSGAAPEDARAVALLARICRQLDGLPLAIELAAACTPLLGLRGVADGLDDRFALLRRGARTALPRQQTLRATVDWSYALLNRDCQTVLARLSLFAGQFSLETAQRTLEHADLTHEAITAAIRELVDKSMLGALPSGHGMQYRLLDTIRAYAAERLRESDTCFEWSCRHARHVLDVFAEAERRADERIDFDWHCDVAPRLDDLRSAIARHFAPQGDVRLAIELTAVSATPSMRFGLVEECLNRVNAALDALNTLDDDANASHWAMKLHAARGACLLYQSVGSHTTEAFAAALEVAAARDDVDYQLRALWGCWSTAYLNGRFDAARSFAHRFAALAARSRRGADRAVARRLTGVAHLCFGELHLAREHFEAIEPLAAALPRAARIHFLYDECMLVRSVLAQALSFLGRHAEAGDAARQALAEARRFDHTPSICYALSEAVCPVALLGADDDALAQGVVDLVEATRRHGVAKDGSKRTSKRFVLRSKRSATRVTVSCLRRFWPRLQCCSHSMDRPGKRVRYSRMQGSGPPTPAIPFY